MEGPEKNFFEGLHQFKDDEDIFDLELLSVQLEYLQIKKYFFENQALLFNKLIHNKEVENKKILIEKRAVTTKFMKRKKTKKKFKICLKGLENEASEAIKLSDTTLINQTKAVVDALVKIDGFYHCPECSHKTKFLRKDMRIHINAVHRKLKPWKCSICNKGFAQKTNFWTHQNSVHATKKDWTCDLCGFRHGTKDRLKKHMQIHLPPSFACTKCDKKFVNSSNLKNHLKMHEGILKEICKHCKKGFTTNSNLSHHILRHHFSKIHCEIPGCLFKTGGKGCYKQHLKITHWEENKFMIKKLLGKLLKLRADYNQMKYV